MIIYSCDCAEAGETWVVSCVTCAPAVWVQYVQKKNPLYSQLKEDTVWSMESFNTYVNNNFRVAKGLPWDWVLGTFTVSGTALRDQLALQTRHLLHAANWDGALDWMISFCLRRPCLITKMKDHMGSFVLTRKLLFRLELCWITSESRP